MKKKLIPFLVLSTFTFGMLTSTLVGCQGPVGPAGPQGPQGEVGKPGEDGKTPTIDINADGYWVINGEVTNVKANGEDGEDGKTPTVEISPDGYWVINGVKTEVKVNGTDGEQGPQGDKGDTAWSNTILPSLNGYVTVNKGSAIVGDNVTFTIYPNNDYGINKIFVNNVDVTDKVVFNAEKLNYDYTETMVDGGFVVRTTFEKLAVSEETIFFDGKPYIGTKTDIFGNVFFKGSIVESLPSFSGGSGTKEDPLLITKTEELTAKNLTDSKQEYFKLANDVTVEYLPTIQTTEKDTTSIDLGGNTLTLKAKTGAVISTYVRNGDELNISNGTIDSASTNGFALFALGNARDQEPGGNLTLNKVTVNNFEGEWDAAIVVEGRETNLNIIDSKINTSCIAISTNANQKLTNDIAINIENSHINSISHKTNRDSAGLLINVPATVSVKNSTITSSRQAVIIRNGTAKIEDSTIEYSREYFNNPTDSMPGPMYGEAWGDGNRVATAAIVVGDTSTVSYNGSQELTLKNVTYKDVTPATNTRKLVPENPYKLYVYGESATYTATVNLDKKSYENFGDHAFTNEYGLVNVSEDATLTKGQGRFIDGVWYDAPYLTNEGNPIPGISTPTFTKFDAGEGTKENPLIVSTAKQLEQITTLKATGELYFKLKENSHLYITERIDVKKDLHVILDLNGGIIDIEASKKSGLNDNTKYLTFMFHVDGEFTLNDSTATEGNKAGKGAILAGRSAFEFGVDSKGTFNAGTITTLSTTNGSAIFTDLGSKLTINYVEVYCSNFTLGFNGTTLEINDGKFVSIANNRMGASAYTYAMLLNATEMATINKAFVRGIQGGISAASGHVTLNKGVDSKTSAEEAKKIYLEKFNELGQEIPFTEEFLATVTENVTFYAVYIAGERNKATAIINGGKYVGSIRPAIYVGNSNDGGVGEEACCTINDGTFETIKEGVSSIIVDHANPNYGYGTIVIKGGRFTANEKTEVVLKALLSETDYTYANLDGYYVAIPKTILGL